MEIGIIGKGKMGRDIFDLLIQFEDEIILICRKYEDIEKVTESIEKHLKKMLRRGYLNASTFEKKMQSFIVSNDIYTLKNCDLIIESVFEEEELKQDIFQRLESIVSPQCILASNTSSIPLNKIFKRCINQDRCLGIHFFFPVKITSIVEINKTKFTDQRYVEIVKVLLTSVGKTYLELNEDVNMILTKMFINVITHVFSIYEENYLSTEEIDKVLKENLVTYGIFEIIDSTGVNIIMLSIDNFINDRYKKLYTPLRTKAENMFEKGYYGGTGNKGLIAFEQERQIEFKIIDKDELDEYKRNIVLSLQSHIINELSYIINIQKVNKNLINEAVMDAFGLYEDPISMLKRMGNQKIEDSLLDSCQRFNDNIYQPLDLFVFSN